MDFLCRAAGSPISGCGRIAPFAGIVNCTRTAYPISGASWVLVYQKSKNAVNGPKLVAFLKWAVTEGQKISPSSINAPLPDEVQQRELEIAWHGSIMASR